MITYTHVVTLSCDSCPVELEMQPYDWQTVRPHAVREYGWTFVSFRRAANFALDEWIHFCPQCSEERCYNPLMELATDKQIGYIHRLERAQGLPYSNCVGWTKQTAAYYIRSLKGEHPRKVSTAKPRNPGAVHAQTTGRELDQELADRLAKP